jgi:RNA polymerase sigma-70 factor (ECF subfamily)
MDVLSAEPLVEPSKTATTAPERPSFEAIFADHAPLVWRALRRLGVADADVEDVCQQVFMTIDRRLESFEGRSAIGTWIYGICVRAAAAYRRGRMRRREDLVATPPDIATDPPQIAELERQSALAALDDVLDELDEDKRAVFVLYEIEELSMKQVAVAVDCPLQTAYARLYAARKQFEAALRRAAARGRLP